MVLFTKECNAILEVAFRITCEMRELLWSEDIRLTLFSPTVNCCVPLLCYWYIGQEESFCMWNVT